MMRTTTALAAAAGVASWLSSSPARAQMVHVPGNDWRQTDRHDAILKAAEVPNFTVELRFGPYLPSIDGEFASRTPFKDVFGLDCSQTPATKGSVSQRFAFGLEVDYLPRQLRIPYVGAVGPGVGWAFTRFGNKAALSGSGSMSCSAETTSLTIMPMHASVVLRADELMRRTGIPIVPYGKFGAGMAWWRAANDSGTEKLCGPQTDPMKCAMGATPFASGTGLTPSLHFALGGAIALNFIEPQAAARLDNTTGVHHAYVFGEYYNDRITLTHNVMRVGTSSWVAGLAVDF